MYNSKQKYSPLQAESEIQERKRQFVTLLEFFVSWPKLQVHQPTSCKERHRTQSSNISLKSKNWKNEIKANGVIGPILQNIPNYSNWFPHPVHDRGPALHGDALEGGEHGQHDVVEAGDTLVRPSPLLQTDWFIVPEWGNGLENGIVNLLCLYFSTCIATHCFGLCQS